MTPQVTIAADMEFNAEQFWPEFRERFPDVAAAIALYDEATVDLDVWRRIQDLDGFDGGPSHARCALFVTRTIKTMPPSQSRPTPEQIRTAEIMARFCMKRGELTDEKCREIVEFLAYEEFFEDTAEWMNAVLYHLTGEGALCRYK